MASNINLKFRQFSTKSTYITNVQDLINSTEEEFHGMLSQLDDFRVLALMISMVQVEGGKCPKTDYLYHTKKTAMGKRLLRYLATQGTDPLPIAGYSFIGYLTGDVQEAIGEITRKVAELCPHLVGKGAPMVLAGGTGTAISSYEELEDWMQGLVKSSPNSGEGVMLTRYMKMWKIVRNEFEIVP